jgi:hypothetical protein
MRPAIQRQAHIALLDKRFLISAGLVNRIDKAPAISLVFYVEYGELPDGLTGTTPTGGGFRTGPRRPRRYGRIGRLPYWRHNY